MTDPGRPAQAPLVFITGASSGIGQALAAAYARRGWRLALLGRRLAVLQDWAQSQGLDATRCCCYEADVQAVDAVVAAAQRCLIEQGLPRVVIANAGISVGIDTAERSDLEVLRELYATNTLGVAATFHPFVRAMQEAGEGRLVAIASVAGVRGLPGHGGYCGSKAAVLAYCDSLRAEMRPDGVRVVALLPGFVDTPLTRNNPYPMPFLMSAADFAERAVSVIERGHARRVIPWQMGGVALLLRLLPDALLGRLLSGRARKPRRT